ncbi:hypothetical protein Tco_0218308 [Tanacetum coccineum]
MARVHKAAQSFTKEEWENIRARVKADEELSRRLQEEERNKYSEVDQANMLQLKRYSFDKLKELFETTMKNVNTFVPVETKDRGRASELAVGSSQATIIDFAEVGSSKRATEVELDHEGSKRQKTNEASGSVQEQPEEEEKELYMDDPLKWRLYDTCGVHHVSTERGTYIFMLVEKEYPLLKGVLTLMLVNRLFEGKPVLLPRRKKSVVRQPTAFKSERPRIIKQRFASQVDVNNNLSKLVTTHYLPKERESVVAKPHHVIASSNSRNSSKNMPRFSSNDMVHNHYLEEAKNKTHDIGRNSKPSVIPSTRSQSTANASKPKPRSKT